MAEPTTPTPAPEIPGLDRSAVKQALTVTELPKPRRFLTADEAVSFLGLRSRSALAYLHRGENPPPCVQLTARNRVYDLADLQAWADARKRR